MPRFQLLIEYEGSNYSGWQIQNNERTIQGEIEKALHVILRTTIRITGAGRTDSGVHARGQVAHFDSTKSLDLNRLKRSLNGVLEKDIRIKSINKVSDDFHARYHAKWRIYKYQIATEPQALFRNQCWYLSVPLNVNDMNIACKEILGQHNFKSFCRSIANMSNYMCTVSDALWSRESELLIFTIKANRFLHGMVRALVGTLVDIGRGKLEMISITEIIDAQDRIFARQSAPVRGLILEEIVY
jgi:tRNA pseudouridine38-40 synthase